MRIAKVGAGHHRRDQALEPFAGLGQLGRDDRALAIDLDADMGRDQPDDAVAVLRRQGQPGVGATAREGVDPERAVRVEQHLDDVWVLQRRRDRRAHGAAQHLDLPGGDRRHGTGWAGAALMTPLHDRCGSSPFREESRASLSSSPSRPKNWRWSGKISSCTSLTRLRPFCR